LVVLPTIAATLPPGSVLGPHYQIIKRLGSGAMGYVLLANDLALDRFVAIKVLRPELSTLLGRDARLRREARLLSRLSHPNVVVLYSFGSESPQLHYMVMEYVRGETLEKRLLRCGQMEPALVWHVMAQIGGAVAEAHRHGIVHRDLKPANVILTSLAGDASFVKVVDFGVAKVLQRKGVSASDSGLNPWAGIVGTPAYMAPEQVEGGGVDARADIYSLGVMTCELLTGRRPFDESGNLGSIMMRKLDGDSILPSRLRPDIEFLRSTPIDAVVARAIAARPEDRYQSVEHFLRDVFAGVRAMGGEVEMPASLSPPRHAPPPELFTSVSTATPPGGLAVLTTLDAEVSLRDITGPEVIRNATVLFLELAAAASATAVELDEYLDCLALVGARLRQVLEQHRGVAMGPLTDSLVVLFRPDAAEDDAERAVDAALAIRSALESLSRDPTVPASFQLAFKIGIDNGRLWSIRSQGVGILHGAAVFEARRLALAASSGEVRFSHGVYRWVRGLYESEVAGSAMAHPLHRLRDSDPPSAGRVVRAKKAIAYLKPIEIHGVRMNLIGREREIEVLRAALRGAVEAREPRVLAVTGPPGIGKSRLVAEFMKDVEDLRSETFRLEVGRCTPGRPAVPYEPFIQAIRHRARLLDDDPPEQARMKIEHYIRRYLVAEPTQFGDAEQRLAQLLAALLGAQDEEAQRAKGEETSDEARRMLIFDAVASVYRRLTVRAPLLFVLEDFVWATAPTKALLTHVVGSMGGCPALFLVVVRAEGGARIEMSFLREHVRVDTLPVRPLSESGEDLARHMLRQLVEVPAWLVRRIVAVAEGVPLIIEETVHDLIDNGVIVVEEARWRLASSTAASVRLPENLEQLFLRRIERLEPRLREALDAAAVAGRRFWPALLGELTKGRCDAALLSELVRRGIVIERRDVILQGEFDYAFAQAAIQEAVYRNLSRATRRALHREAALWLERCAPGGGPMRDEAIGHHFREAGELSRALPYERRAAELSMRTHAIEEAVRLLESCREILTQISAAEMPEEQRQRQLAEVVACLVHELVLAGDPKRAAALAEEALSGLDPSAHEIAREAARIEIGLGSALGHLGRYGDARDAFVRAQRLLGEDGGLLSLRALTGEVGAAMHLGDPGDAAGRLRRAAAAHGAAPLAASAAPRLAPPNAEWEQALSSAHRALGNQELVLGRHEASEAELRRAYELSLSAHALVEEVEALNSRAALHFYRDESHHAEATWRSAIDKADRWDLALHRSVLLTNLGLLELSRGEMERAQATLRHAQALHLQLGSEVGSPRRTGRSASCTSRWAIWTRHGRRWSGAWSARRGCVRRTCWARRTARRPRCCARCGAAAIGPKGPRRPSATRRRA
jgi:serine/threonine-protein kinase